MLNPPFKRCSFDHIFAGGSLEHFRDTKTSSRKIYELVKPTGKFTATVPCVSLSTLPQGLLTGNLPDVPILREIYTLIHVKMLKGKHMMFGYEKSFTAKSITNLFREVGFRDIQIGLYDVEYTLKFFPYKPIKRLVRRLIRIRPFWPAIYVCGRK
jgi:SAM-dependent methyltransferase